MRQQSQIAPQFSSSHSSSVRSDAMGGLETGLVFSPANELGFAF